MDYTLLPTLNAALNTLATVFILRGWRFIRCGDRARHRVAMVTALACSVLFLISYLVYHAQVGSRPFAGTGMLRAVYFFVLITHVLLAAAIVPLVVLTVARAVRGDFARHRAIARWTLPLWLYVSVTGVVVYVMLYRM
jgi:putative membrane protein